MSIETQSRIAIENMNGIPRMPPLNREDNAPSSDGLAGASAAVRIVRALCKEEEVWTDNKEAL